MNDTTFATSIALVLEETRNIDDLRRTARGKLLQFAIDACLVAHGVRTGYLVDVVCPPNPMQTYSALLKALRNKSSVFKDIVCWYHAPTAQSFLVHASLLQRKFTGLLNGSEECLFVKLDKCLSVVRAPPDRLRQAIHDMRLLLAESPNALSFFLPDAFTQEILVPLAAVMIDYPVAYFPACSAQTSFLGGEALDVYTVSFKGMAASGSIVDLAKEHTFLKFSCPQALVGDDAESSPATVIDKLRLKFTARLERIGMCISVSHHTETLDRVAL